MSAVLAGQRHRRRLLEAQVGRLAGDHRLGRADVLGERAVGLAVHLVAGRGAGSRRGPTASTVPAKSVPRSGHLRAAQASSGAPAGPGTGRPRMRCQSRGVDRGGPDPDQDLAVARYRGGRRRRAAARRASRTGRGRWPSSPPPPAPRCGAGRRPPQDELGDHEVDDPRRAQQQGPLERGRRPRDARPREQDHRLGAGALPRSRSRAIIQARCRRMSRRRIAAKPSTIEATMAEPKTSRNAASSAPSPAGSG